MVVMELLDTVSNEEISGASSPKTIRLLVASDRGELSKYRRVEGTSIQQATSHVVIAPNDAAFISATGNKTLSSSNDLFQSVNDVTEKKIPILKVIDASSIFKIITPASTSNKKTQLKPCVLKVHQLPKSPDPSVNKNIIPNISNIKIEPGASFEAPRISLQAKADAISSRILLTTSPEAVNPLKSTQVNGITTFKPNGITTFKPLTKTECSSFIDETLPILTEMHDKSNSNSINNLGNSQPVMMRVNNLGELELDPFFVSTAVNVSEVDENTSCKKEQLYVAEENNRDLSIKHQGESPNVNQNWFTSREDKVMLRYRGHAWRQGMWSKEETDILQKNIVDYCNENNLSEPSSVIFKMSKDERSGFYRYIARGLNRPLFSIYRRVIRMYDNRNHIGKYTEAEVNKLRELRMKHGNNWQAIAALLGRSPASVKDRCRLLNENGNRGPWTKEEENRLAVAVYDIANIIPGEEATTTIAWGEVAALVKTRSEKQCRTKWLNNLNWKRTSGVKWSKSDDIQLICRLSVCGAEEESQIDWTTLAKGWPACRSPHWLRGKWWNLKKKLNLTEENTLADMCHQLYNMQSIGILESTLVQLPTAAPVIVSGSGSIVEKLPEGSGEDSLTSEMVKLCIPSSNFASIIKCGSKGEDFAAKLSALVQTAIVVPNGEDIPDQPSASSQLTSFTASPTLTSSLDSSQLTSSLTSCSKTKEIVVENLEYLKDSIIHLSEVTSGVVNSDALINQDPILSVSGEPLGKEEVLKLI